MGIFEVRRWDVRKSQPCRAWIFPAQFPQNPSDPAEFPHFSRKPRLLKCSVYKRNACKLLIDATLTR